MRATGYLLSCLAAEGVGHVFVAPGGHVGAIPFDFSSHPAVRATEAAHGAGAVFMADGYARASGRFGVCLAAGEADPAGLVAGTASPVLCVAAAGPCSCVSAGSFPRTLRACLTRMLAGPGRPVVLPLASGDAEEPSPDAAWEPLDDTTYRPRFVDGAAVERLWRVLVPDGGGDAPTRVAVLAGSGVEKAGAAEGLAAFAEQFEIPVATTARAKGAFPEDHRLSLGVFGPPGHRHAARALFSGGVEVLVVLGCGLSRADTFAWDERLAPDLALAQVDVDPSAIGRAFPVDLPIVGDCRAALARMLEGGSARVMRFRAGNEARAAWLADLRRAVPAAKDDVIGEASGGGGEAALAAALRRALPRDAAVVVDAGPHGRFFAREFRTYGPRTYFAAPEPGPLGWAVAAAVGVRAALPGRVVACVTDAAGMLAHGLEVAVAARHGLPLMYVVVGDAAGPEPAPVPDFAALARAMGARGLAAERAGDFGQALAEGLAGAGPCLVDASRVRPDEAS